MAEKEYIEREAVMKIIDDYGCTHGGTLGSHSGAVDVVGSAIYKLPAADVAPVVHGEWIPISDGAWAECSECGEACDVSDNGGMTAFELFCDCYKYCPTCGAKMNGGENNGT